MELWCLHFSLVQIKIGGIIMINVDEVYKLNKKINELKKQPKVVAVNNKDVNNLKKKLRILIENLVFPDNLRAKL